MNRKRRGAEVAICMSVLSDSAMVSLVAGATVAMVVVITPVAWMASSWANSRARVAGAPVGAWGVWMSVRCSALLPLPSGRPLPRGVSRKTSRSQHAGLPTSAGV